MQLQKAIDVGGHDADSIFGMDETRCNIAHTNCKESKVGKKVSSNSKRVPQIGGEHIICKVMLILLTICIKESNLRDTLTAIECIGANGTLLPPYFVFRGAERKTPNTNNAKKKPGRQPLGPLSAAEFEAGGPFEAGYYQNKAGYNRKEVMPLWVDHFVKHCKPLQEGKRVLLVIVSKMILRV